MKLNLCTWRFGLLVSAKLSYMACIAINFTRCGKRFFPRTSLLGWRFVKTKDAVFQYVPIVYISHLLALFYPSETGQTEGSSDYYYYYYYFSGELFPWYLPFHIFNLIILATIHNVFFYYFLLLFDRNTLKKYWRCFLIIALLCEDFLCHWTTNYNLSFRPRGREVR